MKPHHLLPLLVVAALACPFPEASGAIFTFNVSASAPGDPADDDAAEAAYLSALADAGYATFPEGFTAAAWEATRSPGYAVSVDSRQINWHSSAGDYLSTSDDVGSYEPRYHIYSKGGSPQEQLHAVPATIIGQGSRTLYGIGVWVGGGPPGKGKLHIVLDDTIDLKFEQVTGYDDNVPPEPIKETILLYSAKQFFGVISTVGFTKFQLLEVEGVLEDQVLMWAADFTIAADPLPGDANGDWVVNFADFQTLQNHWHMTGQTFSDGDFTGDGVVNLADFEILQNHWGETSLSAPLATAIPEPGTLLILALGAAGLLRRRSA